jgi:hypothetical protein
VRASFSGRRIAQKALRRSRDRGCKGHRIPRRVPDGRRHLGSCRAIPFHGAVETATLAAFSRGEARLSRETELEGDAKATPRLRGRERGDRDVRGSIGSGRRGKKTPTLASTARSSGRGDEAKGSACPATIRRSVHGCRETPGPPESQTEPKTPRGVHAPKAA